MQQKKQTPRERSDLLRSAWPVDANDGSSLERGSCQGPAFYAKFQTLIDI